MSTTSICKNCQKAITHFDGRLWHDSSKVLPQYCYADMVHGSRLHEPSPASVEASPVAQ